MPDRNRPLSWTQGKNALPDGDVQIPVRKGKRLRADGTPTLPNPAPLNPPGNVSSAMSLLAEFGFCKLEFAAIRTGDGGRSARASRPTRYALLSFMPTPAASSRCARHATGPLSPMRWRATRIAAVRRVVLPWPRGVGAEPEFSVLQAHLRERVFANNDRGMRGQ